MKGGWIIRRARRWSGFTQAELAAALSISSSTMLAKGAVEYEISGGPIAVAHIDDVIRMKERAGRD